MALNSPEPDNFFNPSLLGGFRAILFGVEERTLRIGFGIKGASEREVGLPELLAFQPALHGREPIPLGPFVANQLLRLNHGKQITESNRGGKLSFIPQTTPANAATDGKRLKRKGLPAGIKINHRHLKAR